MTLDGVIDQMAALGRTAGADDAADARVADLRVRLGRQRAMTEHLDRPNVLLLEWPDPPFTPGHWIPDQIVAAGGRPLLANAGGRSSQTTWEAIGSSGAEILILAPCGFDQSAAEAQLTDVLTRPEVVGLPAVRTGKSARRRCRRLHRASRPACLLDGVDVLRSIIHPDLAAGGEFAQVGG